MIDEKDKIIFELKNIYLNPTASQNQTNPELQISGTLKICENQFGPYLLWQRINYNKHTDGEWDFISNTEADFVPRSPFVKINCVEDSNIDYHNKLDSDHMENSLYSKDNIKSIENKENIDQINKNETLNDPNQNNLNLHRSIGIKFIRFELYDLQCYRCITPKFNLSDNNEDVNTDKIGSENILYTDENRLPKTQLNPPYFIFILKDGTTYPPLQFSDSHNSDKFVQCLLNYLEIKRSYKENDMYIVKDHRAIALEKSFNELNLFGGKADDFVSKFFKDPYTTTFNGFSKVAQLVYDSLTLPQPSEDITLLVNQISLNNRNMDVISTDSDFQLVNCTVLPNKPEIQRSDPLGKQDWLKNFDSQGCSLHTDRIKQIIFKGGVCDEIRKDVWKYLLNYFPWDSTNQERVELVKTKKDNYYRIKLQWKSIDEEQEKNFSKIRERKSLIEKDVHRTDRTHPYFYGNRNPHLTMQYDILMTYTMYNFDIGYVQGMSDLLTPILVVMDDEVDAFWCFVYYMERLQNNFHLDQESMKIQLIQLYNLLAFLDPHFAIYLDKHESGNLYFCFRWLLILFKREFSFNDVMRLWEIFWTDLPGKNFHLLFCLALLEEEKHTIMENRFGLTEILKHINDIANTIDLEKTLKSAEAIWYQIYECKTLPTKIADILGLPLRP
ncbi:unnamed protein product [Gordionus sp. m RMFG-2023]|uniref:TBC1 domain family member 15-like isoform X2 n=1 Tax=Gordionus sp. m RMFG-2023 TaxID=3053472 RepID=UPI0030DE0446